LIRQKHIVFLADSISTQKAGIHYYGIQLIQRILQTYPQHQYTLIASEKISDLEIEQIIIPIRLSIPLHLRLRQVSSIPRKAKQLNPDIVIELAHFGPFFLNKNTKRITVVHDLSPITHPKFHDWQSVLVQKLTLPKIIKNADEIITNSRYTKNEITRLYQKDQGKITVVTPAVIAPETIADWKTVSQKFQVNGPFILSVGTLEPRKNHLSILKAFEKISPNNQELQLIFVGSEGWKNQVFQGHLERSPVKNKVVKTGTILREELWSFYQNASLFVFASEFEGYGIPVDEAMLHHLPILLSDAESLDHFNHKEIVRFNRFNTVELAQKMSEILKLGRRTIDYLQSDMEDLNISLLEE